MVTQLHDRLDARCEHVHAQSTCFQVTYAVNILPKRANQQEKMALSDSCELDA